ncbi:MAG: hypothetical protein HFE85_00995, partial [Clostridiales bacterium]|nr:hypothetical protein [Clostridiales bacterium]
MNKNPRNQTFTLLKAQAPGFFGLYRLFGKSRRFRGLRVAGTVTALTLLGLLMCGVSLSYSFSFAVMLESAGHLSLLPGLMMTLASLMILFTTLYKSSGILFSSGDTDMLLALPVKTSSIVTARILLLYAMDLLFSLVIMVPAGAVYALMASPSPLYWVFFTVMIFLIPLLPLVVASLLGTLVAAIASRFRHGAAIRSLMTILVLLVLCFSVGAAAPNGSVESLDEIGAMLSRMVYSLYPPAFWFVGALAEANVLSFALFCTVSVAAFLVFARLVGWRFQAISNALSSSRARSKYRLTALKTSSPRKAL